MKNLTILTAPNSALLQKSKKVSQIDDSIKNIVVDMIKTLDNEGGIGLAAPQLGIPLRMIIVEIKDTEIAKNTKIKPISLLVLINPEIIKTSEKQEKKEEGCLSVPNVWGQVIRPLKIKVIGLDRQGKKIKIKASGLLARVLQHEIDHLDGILFTDKADLKTLHKITPEGKKVKLEPHLL